MIKLILSAVWICIITLVSSYTAASWKAGSAAAPAAEEGLTGLNYQKTETLNVPMIAEGAIKGYVVAQFVYTADAATLKKLSVPPDSFMLDEAFRTIFSDPRIDFEHLESFDLSALTGSLRESANARFGIDLIQDVLVEKFTFVTREEILAQESALAGERPVVSAGEAGQGEGGHAEPPAH